MGNAGRFVELTAMPEACIANIISLTTPADACRLAVVSSTFRSAAESNTVWDRFLPPDHQSIIDRSDALSSFSNLSKKGTYLRLCDFPLLIDGGDKSFSLDRKSGKSCYMIAARSLTIVWGDTPRYWRWPTDFKCRFPEVAELLNVCWLEISGRINSCWLSPRTKYAAYLVCKFTYVFGFHGQPIRASFGVAGDESCVKIICLDLNRERQWLVQGGDVTRKTEYDHVREREDGWFEVELGEYFNKGEEDLGLETTFKEVEYGGWKGGLVVQGIEIRPKRVNE